MQLALHHVHTYRAETGMEIRMLDGATQAFGDESEHTDDESGTD